MFSHKLFLWRPSSADVPHISQAPVLMLRPRAWNMVEHNMMVVLNFLNISLLQWLFCWKQSNVVWIHRHKGHKFTEITDSWHRSGTKDHIHERIGEKNNTCAFLSSGGGERSSWPSLWLWAPHVSLWKGTVWTEEWTLFLPVKSNTRANLHMFKHADDFIYLGLHCYPLFCRWRAIWRPDFGTKYLFGHSRRFALFLVFMYKLVFVVCLVFLACRAAVHWPYKHWQQPNTGLPPTFPVLSCTL